MAEVRVDSEDRAFRLLHEALEGRFENKDVKLVFDQWPVIQIRLSGEGYDSTITPDIAEALLKVQEALTRSYARFVRNTPDARHLSRQERQNIKFKAKVQSGSSFIEIKLDEFAKKIATELLPKMTPTQVVVTVLGLAVVAGSTVAFTSWAAHEAESKKLDVEARKLVSLSEQETKRLEIITQALSAQPKLKRARADFDQARREIVRGVGDAQSVSVNGKELPQHVAKKLVGAKRAPSKDVQLNGHYTIQKIDWRRGEKNVRLYVTSEDGKQSFIATLNRDSIRPEHQEILKSAEWGRKTIYMSINAGMKRGQVTTARVIAVSWPT
jgi:hypothetical protein